MISVRSDPFRRRGPRRPWLLAPLLAGPLLLATPARADDPDPRLRPTRPIPPHLRVHDQPVDRPVASRVGEVPPTVRVTTVERRERALPPTGRLAVLVYEDKDAGAQNLPLQQILQRLGDYPDNAGRFEVLPVADLEAYSFWPANRFAERAVRGAQQRASYPMYIDWRGEVRRRWGLRRGRSGVMVFDPAGVLRFAEDGPLAPARLEALRALLVANRLTLPPR